MVPSSRVMSFTSTVAWITCKYLHVQKNGLGNILFVLHIRSCGVNRPSEKLRTSEKGVSSSEWTKLNTGNMCILTGGVSEVVGISRNESREIVFKRKTVVRISLVHTTFLNPFHATDLFWCPLKTSENIWFSDILRGYQKRSVSWNGLNSRSNSEMSNKIYCNTQIVRWCLSKVLQW